MDKEDFEDFLSDAIDDSVDLDSTSRDAAKLIMRRLEKAGLLSDVLALLPPYEDSVWDN